MDNWYSVKDKLPEDVLPYSNAKHATIKVLVYIKNKGGGCIRTQTRIRNAWYGDDGKWDWGRYSSGSITHWMPLPSAPKD